MSIVFYAAPMSSATPVACALAELEVPHERVVFDLKAGAHKQPEFLALNPNGKVPTLVVDGTPMFEALAIMQWLGERYGVASGKWPAADAPERMQAMSWSAWAYVSYLQAVMHWVHAASEHVPAAMHNPAMAEYADTELKRLLRVLDERLRGRKYILGEAFTVVDLIVAASVGYGVMCGVGLDGHPDVQAWLARCQQRPSFQTEWNDDPTQTTTA
jgi:glutathione S-transferase